MVPGAGAGARWRHHAVFVRRATVSFEEGHVFENKASIRLFDIKWAMDAA